VSEQALLARLVRGIEAAGIPYMLTGSLVSSLQGVPRASHDVDLVIDALPKDALRIAESLSAPDLYIDVQAVAEAVRLRTMFNVIAPSSGDKADFWLLKDEPYDRERFARRVQVDALGLKLPVSAPEDTILMKLRWAAQAGGSEKQTEDALGVYEFQGDRLDVRYLDRWAEILAVTGALAAIRQRASAGR
jgi:hypothetical protein